MEREPPPRTISRESGGARFFGRRRRPRGSIPFFFCSPTRFGSGLGGGGGGGGLCFFYAACHAGWGPRWGVRDVVLAGAVPPQLIPGPGILPELGWSAGADTPSLEVFRRRGACVVSRPRGGAGSSWQRIFKPRSPTTPPIVLHRRRPGMPVWWGSAPSELCFCFFRHAPRGAPDFGATTQPRRCSHPAVPCGCGRPYKRLGRQPIAP